ncbi:cytochrome oxidase complex assembly protein 1-domain-containing protein [Dichotomopilus funicola]|uniref:Cytochrome oxidase complex assembly protein 1-domain-containing protein n=1 Tax=Dichotomopilus funicola TaxID=1934379 RepID=A0AAN6UXT5_9PEZI|nr:cytochrome oxidase complex assembly protein 1-domain-containing protein [Dichotomopilus funicola]
MLLRLAQQRAGAHAVLLRRRIATASVRRITPTAPRQQPPTKRTLVSAPKPGDGPLMERRPDRELPSISQTSYRWARTLPLFGLAIAIASVAIFNYQKLSSPVTGATLYALRTSDKARALLGDEIYFAQQIPWISGEMNQLHGRIDISFRVKGTKQGGVMKFVSNRPSPRGMFETTEWSLRTDDGTVVDLLEGGDPFRDMVRGGGVGGVGIISEEQEAEEEAVVRGFRKMNK